MEIQGPWAVPLRKSEGLNLAVKWVRDPVRVATSNG